MPAQYTPNALLKKITEFARHNNLMYLGDIEADYERHQSHAGNRTSGVKFQFKCLDSDHLPWIPIAKFKRSGCPECNYLKATKERRVSFDKFEANIQAYELEYGVTCPRPLTKVYEEFLKEKVPSKKYKIPFICEKAGKHRKVAPYHYQKCYNDVTQGRGCPECNTQARINGRKLSFEGFNQRILDYCERLHMIYQGIVEEDYQKYLQSIDSSNQKILRFSCANQHKGKKSLGCLLGDNGCKKCGQIRASNRHKMFPQYEAFDEKKAYLNELIRQHEKLFNVTYRGNLDDDFARYMQTTNPSACVKLQFFCNNDDAEIHIVVSDLTNTKRCPACTRQKMSERFRKSEADIDMILANYHLTRISPYSDYINQKSKVWVKNNYGVEFPVNIGKLQDGKMRMFGSSLIENCIYLILIKIFPDHFFEKIRPDWLYYPHPNMRKDSNVRKNYHRLEIDIFSHSLNFGVEVDGVQHDEVDGKHCKTQTDLDNLKKRDRFIDKEYHERFRHKLIRFKEHEFSVDRLFIRNISKQYITQVYKKIHLGAPSNVREAMSPLTDVRAELSDLPKQLLNFHPDYYRAKTYCEGKNFTLIEVLAIIKKNNNATNVTYKYRVQCEYKHESVKTLAQIKHYGCQQCYFVSRPKRPMKVDKVISNHQALGLTITPDIAAQYVTQHTPMASICNCCSASNFQTFAESKRRNGCLACHKEALESQRRQRVVDYYVKYGYQVTGEISDDHRFDTVISVNCVRCGAQDQLNQKNACRKPCHACARSGNVI